MHHVHANVASYLQTDIRPFNMCKDVYTC